MARPCVAILPTLIWGRVSQVARSAGFGLSRPQRRRRAEPCVAQRDDAAAVVMRKDWLPASAVAHSITSYPVGPLGPQPTFRMLAARKPRG